MQLQCIQPLKMQITYKIRDFLYASGIQRSLINGAISRTDWPVPCNCRKTQPAKLRSLFRVYRVDDCEAAAQVASQRGRGKEDWKKTSPRGWRCLLSRLKARWEESGAAASHLCPLASQSAPAATRAATHAWRPTATALMSAIRPVCIEGSSGKGGVC